ncbi:hypothetical protein R1sor_011234 [Riccia sorocarpa]|uniref:Reverse transcriptase domain-containing protein n=1 Tax=Riccia sorocarpa TaxID=122646 RepID=A0ABD3I0B4_9MARC
MCHLDLKNPAVLQKVKDVWTEELDSVRDERRRWARGWIRVKEVLKAARRDRAQKKQEEDALAKELAWRRANLANDLAKWAKEAVEALEVNDEEVTGQEEILNEIHSFYAELFQAEDDSEDRREAREEVVSLIQKRLSLEDSSQISRMPEKAEIEGVVFSMKQDKAPGVDGLTVQILKICWEWIGDDCIRLIQTIWVKKRILRSDCEGVGGMVIPRSTFVKLDFVKAYDRVDHAFLWRTLECQGFDKDFISLVQGITREGYARVHVNAAFTNEITVSRGVRQGCPLAPLLYALCTQSFMSLLCRANRERTIGGMFIQPGAVLGHQLFADDTGICIQTKETEFDELKKVLELYELTSGAKINLAKSLIMSLGTDTTPTWAQETGCVIAGVGDWFKYLGVRVGVKMAEGVRFQVMNRMKAKIFK